MLRYGSILIFVLFFNTVFSQAVFENNSSLYSWKQINTPKFRILFPEEISQKANYVAELLDTMWTVQTKSYNDLNPRKTTFVLRAENAIPNGFVTMGPRRSEIYMTPPQDYTFLGNNDWLDLVVIHEFRHIVQLDQARRGFGKLIYYLFGENTFSALSFASVPQWFWEGDAIAAETAFTSSGRGRIPAYNRVFKANLLEGKKFSYSKQYLRSYKDFVPNHYVMGTFFVPFVRKYTDDPDVWNNITANTFSKSFMPFIFNWSMKKNTGLYMGQMYDTMMNYLSHEWENEINAKESITNGLDISPNPKIFTSYNYPMYTDRGILSLKNGLGDISTFTLIKDDGDEKKVHVPGIINDTGYLRKSDDYIVWNELYFDPRWRQRTYSVIKKMNMQTGDIQTIGNKNKYVGAAISPNNELIATLEGEGENNQKLMFLSASTGEILYQYPILNGKNYSGLLFDSNDELVVISTELGKKSIITINPKTGETTNVYLSDSNWNIGYPAKAGDFILFVADPSGIDNIFALRKNSKKIFRVTNSTIGAYNPDFRNGKIVFNEQTAKGLKIVELNLKENLIPTNPKKTSNKGFYAELYEETLDHEEATNITESIGEKEYTQSRYRQIKGLINPHSWGPFMDASLSYINAGIFSRDVLSTFSLYGGYNFDLLERTDFWNAKIEYQGLYPTLELEYQRGNRTASLLDGEAKFFWKEEGVSFGAGLPLLLTRSKYRTSLNISASGNVNRVSDFVNNLGLTQRIITNNGNTYFFRDYQANGDLLYGEAGLTFTNFLKQSPRDFIPRWGQSVRLRYKKTLGGDYDGGQSSVILRGYFPGLFKHHSLNGFWAYQSKDIFFTRDDYLFRNDIPVPRGVPVNTYQESFTMGVNYAFPLLYPDVRLGPVMYIKRFTTNLFYDYHHGRSRNDELNLFEQNNYQSTGIELMADFHVFRQFPEIRMGARFTYDFNNAFDVETIFPSLDL